MNRIPRISLLAIALLLCAMASARVYDIKPEGTLNYDWNGALLEEVAAEAHGTDFYGRTGYAGSAAGTGATLAWTEAGLLKSDTSRGITNITYNRRGQPLTVTFRNGTSVQHEYDCFGTLERVTTYGKTMSKLGRPLVTSTRAYAGEFVFGNDTLTMVNFAGGYFDSNGRPHYQHAEWQGSVTLVSSHEGKVVQHTGYYPYGEPWREPAGQPYLFGGKERMREGSLGEYDFTARRLCSALALWTTPDPVNHYPYNPYGYCAGNPVRYIDPSGMEFTEGSKGYIKQFVSAIQQRIITNIIDIARNNFAFLIGSNEGRAEIKEKLSQLYSEITQYSEILNEIHVLRNSNQVYNIYQSSKFCTPPNEDTGEGGVDRSASFFNSETRQFDVVICYYDERHMSHELKHAYQFEIGELSTGHSPIGIPFYDFSDEVEAYKRGALFGQENAIESDVYKDLQKEIHSKEDYVRSGANEEVLQSNADRWKCAFRVNGKTYVGNGMRTNY